MYYLGELYRLGLGVAADEAPATWLRRAAAAGICAPSSPRPYADRDAGAGPAAAPITTPPRSLSPGRRSWRSRGQRALAGLYLAGQGVPRDPAEAARWLQKAADQGLVAA